MHMQYENLGSWGIRGMYSVRQGWGMHKIRCTICGISETRGIDVLPKQLILSRNAKDHANGNSQDGEILWTMEYKQHPNGDEQNWGGG